MKFTTYILTIILAFGLLCGCQREESYVEVSTKSNVELNINLKADNEEFSLEINSLRFLAFDARTGVVVLNQYSETTKGGDLNLTKNGFTAQLMAGKYHFYTLANESIKMNVDLPAINTEQDLKNINLSSSEIITSNIMLNKQENVVVRGIDDNSNVGEISIDNGATWGRVLPMSLDRVAAKVSLKIRKGAQANNTNVIITGVEIGNIPQQSSLVSSITGGEYRTKSGLINGRIELPNESGDFTPIFKDQQICENLLQNNQSVEKATFVKISALVNGVVTSYTVPVGKWNKTTSTYDNYDAVRNTHYLINATIINGGVYVNEIVMTVMPWNEVKSEVGFDDNADFDIKDGFYNQKSDNSYFTDASVPVEFLFTLRAPKNAVWRAHVDNGLDFEFTNIYGGASNGIANGKTISIRIKPKSHNPKNAVCKFYITVNDTIIDLNKDGQVDENDKITIITR